MSKQVMIPDERHAQLIELKGLLSCASLSETIGELINRGFEGLGHEKTVPGFIVSRRGARVVFAFAGATGSGVRRLTSSEARSLASSLDKGAPDDGITTVELNLDAMFSVTRKGNGVKIVDGDTKEARSMPYSLARDLAELLRTAAAD